MPSKTGRNPIGKGRRKLGSNKRKNRRKNKKK